MTDHEKLDQEWPAAEPPAGFADRVLAARRRELRKPRWPWLAALGAAAAAVAALALFSMRQPIQGMAAPLERAQLALGTRGIAVAEPGSALRWTVEPSGAARVQQERGDVFYRVEHGGSFVVHAPDVEIQVTGTCFRVEVVPMTALVKMAGSAAAGALAASAVLVTVYEGKVQVRSAGGGTEVSAGEQARSAPGQAPLLVRSTSTPPALLAPLPSAPDAQSSRDVLVQRDLQSRTQIEALQSRVKQLEGERQQLLARAASQAPSPFDDGEQPAGMPPRNKYHGFTPEELKALAQQCEVRMDIPPLDREPWAMPPELGARLHLSEGEQAQATAAVNQVRADGVAKLRALYLEATHDVNGADSIGPMTLGQEILHKSPRDVVGAARARVAREKAGLETPPADPNSGNIAERYFRVMSSLGDALEQQLQPLGAQQASTLRDKLTPAKMDMNGCNDPQR